MRADNEVTVDRIELKEAVNWTRRGRQAKQDQTFLYLADDGFIVETARATTKIKSVGRWNCKLAVFSASMKQVVAKLPRTSELTLQYFDGWVSVGPVRLSALEVNNDDF